MQPIIETFAGDSAPDITFTIAREDGTIPDLTGATVRLRILDPVTNERTNDAANTCVILDGPGGVVVYSWNIAGTDCPDPGVYRANVQIVYPSGKKETSAVRIKAAEPV